MKSAIATRTFRRSDLGTIVRMDQAIVGEGSYIDDLARNRLVRNVKALSAAPENKAVPFDTAGAPSSASQAGQASQQTTASESDDGDSEPVKKRKRRKGPQ